MHRIYGLKKPIVKSNGTVFSYDGIKYEHYVRPDSTVDSFRSVNPVFFEARLIDEYDQIPSWLNCDCIVTEILDLEKIRTEPIID